MKKDFRPSAVAALIAAALGVGVAAPAAADTTFKLSGFGTLGATMTDNDDTGFRTSVNQEKGAGRKPDLGVDSKLGLQGTANFDNGIAVTGQLLGMRHADNEFEAGFEWLYAQYTGVEGLDLKAGRVVLPAFLVSDSRLVGYSVPWVRVPVLVYSMMPLSHVDGEQVTYRRSIGSAVASVQVTHGKANDATYTTSSVPFGLLGTYNLPTGGNSTTKNILGFNVGLEWGDWTFRLSQIKDDVTTSLLIPVPAAISGFLGGITSIPNNLKFKDKFQEAGVQYDNGTLVVMAEYVKRTTDPKVQISNAWYVGGGYRFGSVMPYAVLSQFEITESNQSAVPPKSKGLAIGARYDFAANFALKGELAQYKNNSLYAFTDSVSPGAADKNINVLSVTLDFVF